MEHYHKIIVSKQIDCDCYKLDHILKPSDFD